MQAELERGIVLAGLKNDPTLPVVRALSTALGLQWRLHDQAVNYYRSISESLDLQVADTIAKGEQALEMRRTSIVEALAPEIAKSHERSVRTWSRTVTLKTATSYGAFAVAMALGIGLAGYGAGWQAGNVSSLSASGALAGALHQAGPDAEAALVAMVRSNNVADAWATCRKSASLDKSGRHVCLMPMWADPPIQPVKG